MRPAHDAGLQAAEGFREYQLKVLSAAQANVNAIFEYAQDMLQTQSMSEVMVLSATHSRCQLETIAQQSREIASAAQKLATETTRPLGSGFGIHQPDELTRRPSSLRTSCGLLRRPVLTVRQRRRAWC